VDVDGMSGEIAGEYRRTGPRAECGAGPGTEDPDQAAPSSARSGSQAPPAPKKRPAATPHTAPPTATRRVVTGAGAGARHHTHSGEGQPVAIAVSFTSRRGDANGVSSRHNARAEESTHEHSLDLGRLHRLRPRPHRTDPRTPRLGPDQHPQNSRAARDLPRLCPVRPCRIALFHT